MGLSRLGLCSERSCTFKGKYRKLYSGALICGRCLRHKQSKGVFYRITQYEKARGGIPPAKNNRGREIGPGQGAE